MSRQFQFSPNFPIAALRGLTTTFAGFSLVDTRAPAAEHHRPVLDLEVPAVPAGYRLVAYFHEAPQVRGKHPHGVFVDVQRDLHAWAVERILSGFEVSDKYVVDRKLWSGWGKIVPWTLGDDHQAEPFARDKASTQRHLRCSRAAALGVEDFLVNKLPAYEQPPEGLSAEELSLFRSPYAGLTETKIPAGHQFALIDHPEHGLIGVSWLEAYALGLIDSTETAAA